MILQIKCQYKIWVVLIEPVSCTPLGVQDPFLCALQITKVPKSNKYRDIQDFGPSQVFQVVLTSSASTFGGRLKCYFFSPPLSSTNFSCLQRKEPEDRLIPLFVASLIIWHASRTAVVQIPGTVACISLT